jgi:hypothetical protein
VTRPPADAAARWAKALELLLAAAGEDDEQTEDEAAPRDEATS